MLRKQVHFFRALERRLILLLAISTAVTVAGLLLAQGYRTTKSECQSKVQELFFNLPLDVKCLQRHQQSSDDDVLTLAKSTLERTARSMEVKINFFDALNDSYTVTFFDTAHDDIYRNNILLREMYLEREPSRRRRVYNIEYFSEGLCARFNDSTPPFALDPSFNVDRDVVTYVNMAHIRFHSPPSFVRSVSLHTSEVKDLQNFGDLRKLFPGFQRDTGVDATAPLVPLRGGAINVIAMNNVSVSIAGARLAISIYIWRMNGQMVLGEIAVSPEPNMRKRHSSSRFSSTTDELTEEFVRQLTKNGVQNCLLLPCGYEARECPAKRDWLYGKAE